MRSLLVALFFAAACASAGPRTAAVDTSTLPAHGRYTVLVFYAEHCNCLLAHDPRLLELDERFRQRGVTFLFVDSQVDASQARDEADVRARGYRFPVVMDRGGKLADAVGAQYATYSVILDEGGNVRYHGGIDDDRSHLHDGATPYLARALDDVLAGRPVRTAGNEGLGCALRKW